MMWSCLGAIGVPFDEAVTTVRCSPNHDHRLHRDPRSAVLEVHITKYRSTNLRVDLLDLRLHLLDLLHVFDVLLPSIGVHGGTYA